MMLRISEVYTSLQGEGPNTGLPTQFVRFAGCNLRCPGWPCDTPHAIEPSIWRKEALKLTETEKALDLVAPWPKAVTFTGGEPFIQNDAMLQEFTEGLWERGYSIEVFTNGTQEIPPWARPKMRFMLDWKLKGSGEEKIGLEPRFKNTRRLTAYDGVKFVIKDGWDLGEAVNWTRYFNINGIDAQIWAGIVWGSEMTDALLSQYILEHELPWRLNVQMHNHIWDPQERGR